jgi:hypothetical protein
MKNMIDGQIITVEHVAKDGWHEFTCPQVPGFHLISKDDYLEGAYSEVPDAIVDLIRSDENILVEVTLENSYSEYLADIPEPMRPFRHYSIRRVA